MKYNDLLLRTLSGEKSGRPPVWLMRQAGRYMSEYMAVRGKVSFLELCKTPDLAVEVTWQPIHAFGMDAAILFSDILVPVEPMGVSLDFNPAPVIHNPVRDMEGARNLNVSDPKKTVPFVYEIIRKLVKTLPVPLIGFCGAPFTLACYMVEGKGSRNFLEIKKLMNNDLPAYELLMDKLTESMSLYLQAQIDEGCPVVQIFDTWAGILSPDDYKQKVLPWVDRLIKSLTGAYVIYFAKDAATYFEDMKELGCSCIGVDWKTDLEFANRLLSNKFILQGNMDPALLFTDKNNIERVALDIIEKGRKVPGHIFNLGHGIMPLTPRENVKHLVDVIKGSK